MRNTISAILAHVSIDDLASTIRTNLRVLIRGHLSLGQEVIVCALVEDLCISYAQDENRLIKSWFHAYRC